MLPVGIGSSGVDTGDIGHSLRFAASRSCYMSRTITTATTSTYFAVVKRGKLGVISPIFDTNIKFNANDTLTAFGLTTTAVFRDPTSWLFIHISNNGLYINGVSFGAVTTSAITNPRIGFDGTNYFDGYIARCGVVDGTSAYTNFGYLNTEINEWVSKTQAQVKAVVDAGGTNSFMLDFDNGSSLTTLGYDKSSKGNNWTLNNFSLTAGVNYDWMLDVPGNSYAVINSLLPVSSTAPTISDANLKWTRASTAPGWTAATMPLPQAGKWYWETDHTSDTSGAPLWSGVVNSTRGAADDNASNIAGVQAVTGGWDGKKTNATTVASYINPGALTATLAHAYDGATGKYWCGYVSGGSITWGNNGGVGDPAAGTNPLETISGVVTPAFGQFQTVGATRTITEYFNAGQRPFSASTLPTGFKALCQANMPEVPAAYLNPSTQVQVKLDTGANIKSTAEAVFPYLLEIIKDRGNVNNWQWLDSVRGLSNVLQSNTTAAETTYSAPSGSSVATVLKVPSTGVSNTAGSITSTVSANTDAGFSIVTYTGTGANATVGHGCKVNGVATAPGLIIIKRRVESPYDWPVYHSGLTSVNYYLTLNGTAAQTNYGSSFIAPSATTFSLDASASLLNTSTKTYVAYCFAPGFFSIGSYTGNGSSDGPFVYTGHKPRWLLVKCSSAAGYSWNIIDTARDPYNTQGLYLFADSSAAEGSGSYVDILSDGFKPRNVGAGVNGSGNTYIYISIPDVFAKYSLAR